MHTMHDFSSYVGELTGFYILWLASYKLFF